MEMGPVFVHMMVVPELSHEDALLLRHMMKTGLAQMHMMLAPVQIHRWVQLEPMHAKVVWPGLIHSNQHQQYSHEQLEQLHELQPQVF
jgi:hypothetical protein